MTRVPSDNTGSSREELICPHCFSPLEKHTVYAEEYSGRASLVKATKCTDKNNEDCPYKKRVPPDVMEEVLENQYRSPSIISKIRNKITAKNLAILTIGLVVLLVFVGNPLSGGQQATTDSIQIETSVPLGAEYDEGVVIKNYNTGNSISSGNTLNYPTGEGVMEITIDPVDSRLAKQYARVNFDEKEVIEGPETLSLNNQSISVELNRLVNVTRQGVISNGFVVFDISHPENIGENIKINMSPPGQDAVSDTRIIDSGSEREINIPGILVNQEAIIRANPDRSTVTETRRYTGGTDQIELKGNVPPQEIDISVNLDEASSIEKSITKEIRREGTLNPQVDSSEGGKSVRLKLFGVMQGETRKIEDKWDGGIRAVNIREGPATLKATMIGNEQERKITKQGTSNNNSIILNIEGKESVENVTINFTGASKIDNTIATESISVEGEKRERTVTTIRESGEYIINFEGRGENGFNAGYYINSDYYTESSRFNLSRGDEIRLSADAESQQKDEEDNRDVTSDKQFNPPPGYPLKVESTEVSETTVDRGDSVRVSSTIYNPTNLFYTGRIILFKNGEEAKTRTLDFSAGERKEVIFRNVRIDRDGQNTISVNQGDPIIVDTGNAPQQPETQIPSGETAIEIKEVVRNTSVKVDTNRDGNYNCDTNPEKGSCLVEFLGTGEQVLPIQTQGVSNISYNYTYETTVGQRDPEMTIGGRKILQKKGVLSEGQEVSKVVQFEEGSHKIQFPDRNLNISYKLEWAKSSEVSRPAIDYNGERIVSSDQTYRGKTYELRNLDQGQNQITITETSGNPFYARLNWEEEGDALVPSVLVDGEVECTGRTVRSNECTIGDITEDSISLSMFDGKTPINYTISYVSIRTPERVALTINDKQTIIEKTPGSDWESVQPIDSLESGKNSISLETFPEGTRASARINYNQRLQNPVRPVAQFLGPDSRREIEISPDNIDINTNELTGEVEIEIPRGWITEGNEKNKLEFSNANSQGGVKIQVQTNMSESDSIEFNEKG